MVELIQGGYYQEAMGVKSLNIKTLFSVQKSHKAVRAGQYLRPMQLRIVPSMEIGVHLRLILARYKGCTIARCILPRSYVLAEFKNVNPFSVQKAHKAVRAGQYLRPMQLL